MKRKERTDEGEEGGGGERRGMDDIVKDEFSIM